mgnify:CR=1 FL=1
MGQSVSAVEARQKLGEILKEKSLEAIFNHYVEAGDCVAQARDLVDLMGA